MAAGKEIRKKIKSVKSTQKITKAMEMVAASKMRRTQEQMRQGRPYAEKIRKMIGHLANSNPEYRHVFMTEREVKRVGYIVVSTDKGLVRRLERESVPRAGQRHAGLEDARRRIRVRADRQQGRFVLSLLRWTRSTRCSNNIGDKPTVESLVGGIRVMLDAYSEGRIDRLFIATNTFVNTMSQRPVDTAAAAARGRQ